MVPPCLGSHKGALRNQGSELLSSLLSQHLMWNLFITKYYSSVAQHSFLYFNSLILNRFSHLNPSLNKRACAAYLALCLLKCVLFICLMYVFEREQKEGSLMMA